MSTSISSTIFRSFSSTLSWNAFAYLIHKSASTLRTFILFYTLSAQDFSMWATSMSAIFLLLLWLDLGLRKSIPLFAPLFTARRISLLTTILIIHLTILTCALPFLFWLLGNQPPPILILTAIIYLAQGTQSILMLIYHAHFLNKQFTLITSSSSTFELGALLITVVILPQQMILPSTFIITAISSVAVCLLAYKRFFEHKSSLVHPNPPNVMTEKGYRSFITHSLTMWLTTIIKSFSERNFLLLLLTSSRGAPVAAMFKLANDGALFFYRTIIKTIGVADTALLAQIDRSNQGRSVKKLMMNQAVKELITKTGRIILPLLGIFLGICFIPNRLWNTPSVFHAFLIMTVGYGVETILVPYERILEVRRHYRWLFLSYLPYIGIMIVLITMLRVSSIGLLPLLLCIHTVRLVSYLLIRIGTYQKYGI